MDGITLAIRTIAAARGQGQCSWRKLAHSAVPATRSKVTSDKHGLARGLTNYGVLAQRRGAVRNAPAPQRGYAQPYMNTVLQAEHGCDSDFLRSSPTPRP